ncbi:DIE2/ALG10 family-domain-containing protein [Xylariaceae sp. FL0016]|nr:DIE2/ALG10 family-domain-containing protein [Xylariaceae sp. FL0016]
MGAFPNFPDVSLSFNIGRYALLYGALQLFIQGPRWRKLLVAVIVIDFAISQLALRWLQFVDKNVPEPYLDEIFHIPQAQAYCDKRYYHWDDKITTPPGLYVLTILFSKVTQHFTDISHFGDRSKWRYACSAENLRFFNANVAAYCAIAALVCRARLEQPTLNTRGPRRYSSWAIGTGLNVALFPVLFFFSGLYYTDPISTFVVLLAYTNHLSRLAKETTSLRNDLYTLFLGLLTLFMRQTNIFWVVIYMGGLEVVYGIKMLKPEPVETPGFSTLADQVGFYAWRYSLGDIHDPPLGLVNPVDVVLCTVSIGTAAVCNLGTILGKFLWPHGVLLAAFASFVAWNGGVVLGDKSNHVATLHLAQMLYIWPLFTFFSLPLMATPILNFIMRFYYTIISSEWRRSSNSTTGNQNHTAALRIFNYLGANHLLHRILTSGVAVIITALVVRFNTIIHPFTLADNRHYMFYVFRYSFLRAWWVRYALVPVYVGCAWLCWITLQGPPIQLQSAHGRMFIQSPFSQSSRRIRPASNKGDSQGQSALSRETRSKAPTSVSSSSPPTSTILLLFLATTLSLVTAPLVEPRYFILPWVFWRLLVPAWPSFLGEDGNADGGRLDDGPGHITVWKPLHKIRATLDLRIVLETAWFLLINAGTMYVFLMRPFYWRAEDGKLLDNGNLQRFMW